MSWNYRIIRHTNTNEVGGEPFWFAIHEVYYNDKGEENGWTKDPITFVGDSPDEIVRSLRMALSDALKYPNLEDE